MAISVITTDILLKGTVWQTAVKELSPIFKKQTNYSIFFLAAAIGVMYDQQIETADSSDDDAINVPRTVLGQHLGDLDFLFQSTILTTKNMEISEDERLTFAFADEKSNSTEKLKILTKFANFGITKLAEKIGSDVLETMENIKNFLASSMEGTNFEIDELSDDELQIETNDLI